MESLELSAIAETAYTAILTAYIAATTATLALHIMGRHQNCVRNLVISASLAVLSLLAARMKTFFTAQALTQAVEAIAYLTMFLTPLLLLLSKLYELNNSEFRAVQERGGKLTAALKSTQIQTPATSQNRQEPEPATTYNPEEYKPTQLPMTQVPAQKPVTLQTPSPNTSRLQPPTSTAKNVSQNIGTSPKPAKRSGEVTVKGKLGEKNRPTIEDIIYSEEYAHLLVRIFVKILRRGVRYNGQLYRMHLTYVRYQDIIYIWQLGKKKKKIPMTDRSIHRLRDLRLVRVRKKVRLKGGMAEIAQVVEMTERGWSARNAIALAAKEVQKRVARTAATYIL